jgi:hypothetical protein
MPVAYGLKAEERINMSRITLDLPNTMSMVIDGKELNSLYITKDELVRRCPEIKEYVQHFDRADILDVVLIRGAMRIQEADKEIYKHFWKQYRKGNRIKFLVSGGK